MNARAHFHTYIAYKLLEFQTFISISVYCKMHCKIVRYKNAIACTFLLSYGYFFYKFLKKSFLTSGSN